MMEKEPCRVYSPHEALELPMVQWEVASQGDFVEVSLIFLSRSLAYITKFTYDLLSRWTVPGKRVSIPYFCSAECAYPQEGGEPITSIEARMKIDSRSELEVVSTILPMLESELKMGAQSFFHASRIMEVKGLTLDEKAALVQDQTLAWIDRYPELYDTDLLHSMQEFFLLSRDSYKAFREVRHLTQIVVVFYTFAKRLMAAVESNPQKRHLFIRLFPATVQSPLSSKQVLGVFVGMNHLRPNEVFQDSHLFKALQNCHPRIRLVRGSSYIDRPHEESRMTQYLEIEKEDGEPFAAQEIKKIKNRLLEQVRHHIEHLVSPIFMPRNEEEILKNIVTLGQELRYVKDLPQVIVSFDQQTDDQVFFSIVLVSLRPQLAKALMVPFEELTFSLERVKTVGYLRNKYPKEALVLKACLLKAPYLREDLSLDLYAARQCVLEALQSLIGEVRDYNGGMLAKQIENFRALKIALGEAAIKHKFLLENFFHSLFPIEVRSFLNPESMKSLFHYFLAHYLDKPASKRTFSFYDHKESLYIMMGLQDAQLAHQVIQTVKEHERQLPKFVFLHQHVYETTFLGFILLSEDLLVRDSFIYLIKNLIKL